MLADPPREDRPAHADASQSDVDADGFGDLCDNCPLYGNAPQVDLDLDLDGDGEGDHCDLDDALIYLLFNEPAYVEWQQEQGFETWNFYQSDLFRLLDTGIVTPIPDATGRTVKVCYLPDPLFDAPDLDPGQASYFLTTGNDAAGTESELGYGRVNTNPCP